MDRVLEGNLRATEIILALSHAHNQGKIWDPESTFPYRYSSQLSHARRSLAVFQHHDGVTGTARDHVMIDYGRKMHSSLVSLNVRKKWIPFVGFVKPCGNFFFST